MNILVTGSSGFVGTHLCKRLINDHINFKAIVRNENGAIKKYQTKITDLNANTDWENVLKGIDVVVHLAGRAHVMHEARKGAYEAYESINVLATKNLALQAAESNVKRLVFISSIGVNGNISDLPLNETHPPNPQEYYAISKKEAEDELRNIASKTKLEVVIVRPPLVYGSGVKANFKKLIALSKLKFPLPFGATKNTRSLIFVENLVDFILLCTKHPKAANETFLISDDDDVSTTLLIQTIAEAVSNKIILLPIPSQIVKMFFCLIGKKNLYIKVFGSLCIDVSKAKTVLGWKPPYTFKQGIAKTVREMN